jgi:hypothetical protein
MDADFELFEIPVYRTNHQKYLELQAELRDRAINPKRIYPQREFEVIWEPIDQAAKEKLIQTWEDSFNRSDEAVTWKYNEIIGFIRLDVTPGQIKGEYYMTKAKRLRRTAIVFRLLIKIRLLKSEFTKEKLSRKSRPK